MKLTHLKRVNQKSIQSAGPRYTPGQDASAPNLEIASLNTALDGLICGSAFKERIRDLSNEIEKSFTSAANSMRGRKNSRLRKPSALLTGLDLLASTPPGEGKSLVPRLRRYTGRIEIATERVGRSLYTAELERREALRQENHDQATFSIENDPELRVVQNQQTDLRNYQAAINDVEEFLRSPGCELQYNNMALLLGEWGTGKTHYLCDFALTCIDHGVAALIVLAKDFEPDPDIGTALAQYTGLASNLTDLITQLNSIGIKSGQRSLLIIDGINESDRQKWRQCMGDFRKSVNKIPYVGLVLSCRQPFEHLVFKDVDKIRFTELTHHGFSDIEFDAQSEFFHFYDIPLPEVPLLAEEFSRPLTLKIMCEAFKELPRRNQRRGFAGITSGQRGMTYVLEKFINSRAKGIESDLKLPGRFCWKLIKGDNRIGDPSLAGLAPYMADAMQEYVPKERCLEMIRVRSSTSTSRIAKRLYRRLVTEGILVEDIEWRPDNEGGSLTVVRFPYQRFGDHLVARHLLGEHLDTRSEQSIRRSFYKNNKLGSLFLLESTHFSQYVMEGWVEALVVEFPERTKNVLPENKRELFFYLPKGRRDLRAYFSPFVGGLFWRNPSAISEQTDRIVGTMLWSSNEYRSTRLLEALLAVATKPEHPYHGARLFLNLEDLKMVDRDMAWSEFLRKRASDSTVERLVLWFEKGVPNGLNETSALNQIHILSLFLTTNDKLLRDRVTKVLVQVGEKFPNALFSHSERCFSFSDPYVPERMLAASYGVAMSLWSEGKANTFHKHLQKFARVLVREIFTPDGCLMTHHTLVRDYALGIIELARRTHRGCIAAKYVKYIKPPFPGIPDLFPDITNIREQDCKDIEHAIRMDFGNYTIGRLVSGRSNYDMDHPGYRGIRKKIEWRIRNLGYRWKDFELIEQTIGRESIWRARSEQGKIDRYGKKYSWIAFFEMHGFLQSQGKLPDARQDERISDCDIDPSFPVTPPEWKPQFHDLFSDDLTDELDWISRGPSPDYKHLLEVATFDGDGTSWVLIDGFIQETDADTDREIFSFLQGLILDESDVSELETHLGNADHPGSGLPEAGQDVYTFAGEVPWSRRFASAIRTKSGKLRQISEEAFSETLAITKRRRLKKAWIELYEILGEVPRLNRFVIVTSEQGHVDVKVDQGELEQAILEANSNVAERDRITTDDFYNHVPTPDDIHKGYQFVTEWRPVPGVPVNITSWYYGWESYHSRVNSFTGFRFPAPRICEQLGLVGRHRSIELLDQRGKQASVYRKSKQNNGSRFDVLYLRKDLLDRYLKMNRKVLVWIIWGERQFHHDMYASVRDRPEVSNALQNYEYIYKKLVRY